MGGALCFYCSNEVVLNCFSDFAKTRTLFKFKKMRVGETAELNWPNTNTYVTRSKPYMDKAGFSLHYKKSQHN
jgi:hypothetical protein